MVLKIPVNDALQGKLGAFSHKAYALPYIFYMYM